MATLHNYTPDNGALREVGELLYSQILTPEKLGSIFTIFPNQYNGNKVGFVGEFGLVGKATTGCNTAWGSSSLGGSEKEWKMKEIALREEICYSDLVPTLAKTALKKGVNIADLTGTDVLEDVFVPRAVVAWDKTQMRYAFFGDTSAANVTSGGVIKDGVDVDYFNAVDGIFKQAYEIVATDSERRVTILANAQNSISAQKSAFKASGVATGIMDDLIASADMKLRQAPNQVIIITQAFKDALDADIRKTNVGSNLQWESIFNGMKQAEYNGIRVVVMPILDEMIQSYQGDGIAYNEPYRAIYTSVDNLGYAVGGASEVGEVKIFFDDKSETTNMKIADSIGALIFDDKLIQVAY